MALAEDDRSAALLVRVWLEGGTEFRARVTAVGRDGPHEPGEDVTVALASSPGDVVDAVRDWIDDFVRHPSEGD